MFSFSKNCEFKFHRGAGGLFPVLKFKLLNTGKGNYAGLNSSNVEVVGD